MNGGGATRHRPRFAFPDGSDGCDVYALDVHIRAMQPGDRAAVDVLLATAFATATSSAAEPPIEVGLNTALLDADAVLPHLTLVAELDGEIVGYCISTRGTVDATTPVLGLGPIAVAPERQRDGIGSALVRETIRIAEAHGEGLLVLLGDPGYYGRFGFVAGSELGVDSPEPAWGAFFQALRLTNARDEHRGAFRYAAPFEAL